MSTNLSFKIAGLAIASAAVLVAAPSVAQEAMPDNWLNVASVASRTDVQAAAVAARSSSIEAAGGERTVFTESPSASPLTRAEVAARVLADSARFVPDVYNIGG
jgi:hypothetical protein